MKTTGSDRYRNHQVWETLALKREALNAARFDDAKAEQWRVDIVEWLDEAGMSKYTRQPALYLSALTALGDALNALPTDHLGFKKYVGLSRPVAQSLGVRDLESALRSLPLPQPKNLHTSYVNLLDKEIEARTTRLDTLEAQVSDTEKSLQDRKDELSRVAQEVEALRGEVQTERDGIRAVSESTQSTIREDWDAALKKWQKSRDESDSEQNEAALSHIATLTAIAESARVLAEHAAGELSASDWSGRAKRERRSAQWLRSFAIAAFVFAGAIGLYIMTEAIRNDLDLALGDGILRSTVALVIGVFGGLLIRESGRHFREADTAEEVSLALKALAPFYANSDDKARVEARAQVGDAVLVKNVLSRFAHRDAARHAGDVNSAESTDLIKEATAALNLSKKNTTSPDQRE